MTNLGQMLKQAQQMQARMAEMQAQLEGIEIDGSAGGGLVTVTLSGKGLLRRLKIDPSLVNADDIEVLEDLIVAAFNDAKAKVESRIKSEMRELTGGLELPPGMSLPF